MKVTRRRMVGGALALLGGGGLSMTYALHRRVPVTVNGQPVLRMPFPSGTVVLCQQANLQPEGRTHSSDNCLHALDFSNGALGELEVVAAAPGRVGFVFAASTPGDFEAGARFGNHVALAHEGGYYTLYAHLRSVAVQVGQAIDAGTPIGLAGMTGAAGNRHLHFALHAGETGGPGAPGTTPVRAVVAADVSVGIGGFEIMEGASFVSGADVLWAGRLYASENGAGLRARVGELDDLSETIMANRARLREALDDRVALEHFKDHWEARGPAWAEGRLAPMMQRETAGAVTDYWWGVAVELARGEVQAGRARLEQNLERGEALGSWESWLAPAIHMRLGRLDKNAKAWESARLHFEAAARMATSTPTRDAALREHSDLGQQRERARE